MPRPDHIDDETWRLMVSYGGDPYLPQQVKVELLSEWSDQEWSLAEFYELVAEAVKQVPPELMDAARVEFKDGDFSHFEIYYYRPETPAEQEANAQRYLEYARNRQAHERESYARLKAKFEPSR